MFFVQFNEFSRTTDNCLKYLLLRITRLSPTKVSMSSGPEGATVSISKSWKASRTPGHLDSITRQRIPDWKAALVKTPR